MAFPQFDSIVQIVSSHPINPPTELAHPPAAGPLVAGQQNGFCELHPLHVPGGQVGTGIGVGVGVGQGIGVLKFAV